MNGEFTILALTILGAVSILLSMKSESSLITLFQVIGVASIIWLGVIAGVLNTQTVEVKQPITPNIKIETIQIDDKIVSDTTYIYNFKIKQ